MMAKEIVSDMLPVSVCREIGTGSVMAWIGHDPDTDREPDFYFQFEDDIESFMNDLVDENLDIITYDDLWLYTIEAYISDDYRVLLLEDHPLKLY